MNRLKMSSSVLALLLLIFVACGKSGANGNGDENASHPAENNVVPETPAPMQPTGKEFLYNFDNDVVGKLPSKFHEALTGQGAKAQWLVSADASAPSQPNVIAQLSTDKTDYRFPLAIADEGSFQDLEMSVKFKAVSGEVDRAAGLVFRLTDANNYYIVRANALENNYRLYHVVKGRRVQFAGANVRVASGEWHQLRVECVGNHITCYYDNEKKIDATDETFKEAGKVGLWTKADSVTYFDDLRVTAK
jgi:3-keto-disaccharide hydrolase